MDYIKLNKEISYVLRHAPETYELEMDEYGFVDIKQLLDALNDTKRYDKVLDKKDLEISIKSSDKIRHEIVDDKIRALYGHSFNIVVKKEASIPPLVLYHGTKNSILDIIMNEGLKPMSRQYVHLSVDIDTAVTVGKRRDDNPVILKIDTISAINDGVKFYLGNDKIWLCDYVDPKYISIVK